MKRMKKIVSILLAVVMVLGMSVTAFAANDGSITIKGGTSTDGTAVSVAGKTFKAYQILTAELVNGTSASDGIVYRVPEGMEEFYAKNFRLDPNQNSFDQDVVDAISKMDAETLELFAKDALAAAKDSIKAGNTVYNKAATVPGYIEDSEGSYWLVDGENGEKYYTDVDPGDANNTTKYSKNTVASVTINELPLGYYVVEDEGLAAPISALALTTAAKDVDVNIKASQPTIDKKIDGDNDTDDATTGSVDNNNAAVGDKVPYIVTSKVPNMSGYEKYYFIVEDTLSEGLSFNNDVTITIGNKTLTRGIDFDVYSVGVNLDGNAVTEMVGGVEVPKDVKLPSASLLNADKIHAIKIVFRDFIQYKDLTSPEDGDVVESAGGADIRITYSATINEKAEIGIVGNPNKVKLTYSNNPNTNWDGDPEDEDKPKRPDPNGPKPPTGVTPEKETRTYVTGIELTKVDSEGMNLAGAEFKIEGEKINTVLVSEAVFTKDENGNFWKLCDGRYTTQPPIADYQATDEDGNLMWDDEEHTVPTMVTGTKGLYENDGEGPMYIRTVTDTVQQKAENVDITATVDASGVLRFNGLSAGTYTITELKAPNGYNLLKDPIVVTISFTKPAANSTNCTWSATIAEANKVGDNSLVQPVNITASGIIEFDVQNMSGALLPSTGGIGTTIFYVGGSILVLAAVVLLVTKKRMSHEK